MEKWRRCRAGESGPWELREGIRARVSELRGLLDDRQREFAKEEGDGRKADLLTQAREELDRAEEAVSPDHSSRYKLASHVVVGQIHIDAAHNTLLRLSKPRDVVSMLPSVRAFVQEHMPPGDPRRVEVERIARTASREHPPSEQERETLLDAMGVARQTSIRETMRVRSFIYIVWWVMLGLTVMAVLVALLGVVGHDEVPLCFTPEQPEGGGRVAVCPVGTERIPEGADTTEISRIAAATARPVDYLVVEVVGLVAACIAAAATLRRIRGTATPFEVPLTLALLKLPTGALTAVLGILLMRGEFIPGLTYLDSSAQIIAWAVVFGYAQQVFTHFVDNQAQSLLSAVRTPGAANHAAAPAPPPAPAEAAPKGA
ncbi:hypothetical protein [Streptomyces sp. JJ36]|uniref:hypothetical protein n=1 Tax=Streptomyces sp. JJ36 TaxID=2736645 RepID=UPI001F1B9002|nr:hypothetical protein [Streptomyces sp. JJ36]MCF6523095.1 hypothetical protein [Streptomyces sp. JJ36]